VTVNRVPELQHVQVELVCWTVNARLNPFGPSHVAVIPVTDKMALPPERVIESDPVPQVEEQVSVKVNAPLPQPATVPTHELPFHVRYTLGPNPHKFPPENETIRTSGIRFGQQATETAPQLDGLALGAGMAVISKWRQC
jgi:hypothetical protein